MANAAQEEEDIDMDPTTLVVTDPSFSTSPDESVEIKAIESIDAINVVDSEQRELVSLWDTMKEFEKFESGNTNESIHRKHLRFTMEKEFVEMLSNPQYLHHLAINNYFEDKRFIAYLEYLQYWQKAEYAKCIQFVHSLRFLELLQIESFRNKLKEPNYKELIHSNQYWHWKHYRANRHWSHQKKELEIQQAIEATKLTKSKKSKKGNKNKKKNANANANVGVNANAKLRG